jgi:transcriptional regulator with XRE-family HTH domain
MAKSKTSKEEIILEKLGSRITRLRKKLGKSQNDLSYEIGWDKPNLRKIEKGKTNPTVKTLIKISEALQISLSELFKIEDDK